MYPQAALQVWDASPTGDGITTGDVIQGLDAAIRRGQGVINLSLGSQVRNPVLDSMVAVTVSSGTLVVAAAGNSRQRGSPLEYPASLPHVLTVGAIDQGVAPASFSSGSPHVDLAAPGTSIRVAVPTTFHPPIFYDSFHGTSFAAPLVAGSRGLGLDRAADARPQPALRGDARLGAGRLVARLRPAHGLRSSRRPTRPRRSASGEGSAGAERGRDLREAGGLLRRAAAPLTAASRKSGGVTARLDVGEDPRDVYRVWIPGRRAASIALQPSGGDVDLAAWGPKTKTVLETGSARRRDFRGLSERTGAKRERLRVRNPATKGAYFYVEASLGAGSGNVVRKVAGLKYSLAVSIVKPARR